MLSPGEQGDPGGSLVSWSSNEDQGANALTIAAWGLGVAFSAPYD
ncbi:MAG TPA: hypothetical protein VM683_01190 [Anaeromyxobacteraceae bacterium]|nr:hypothetical protein [Anaeromyxobacteraceae bacterium]